MNLKSKLPTKFQKYASFGIVPKLIFLPFALGFIALILLLRPFVVIKFFKVNPWRIGHLLVEVEIARINALEASKTKKHCVIYYFPERRVANEYVVQMWKRVLPTISGSWGWLLYTLASNTYVNTLIVSPKIRDTAGLTAIYPTNLRFNQGEIEVGQEFLRSVNCQNHKFVCLMVRDSAYLKNIRTNKSFEFYKYRDSNISTYLQAAETLTEMGYTVFRMGQIVANPIESANPKIIDYATNGMRTEFLDVYLGANCEFCISTGTGFDNIPQIFRRPLMYLNGVGFFEDLIVNPFLIYPKIYKDSRSQKFLSLKEIADRGIQFEVHDSKINASGTVIEDLDATEINAAVLEMVAKVEGRFVSSSEDEMRMQKVQTVFRTHPSFQYLSNYGKIRGELASCFLSRYSNFLD